LGEWRREMENILEDETKMPASLIKVKKEYN
jgi:hypothetical protein